MLGRQLRCQNDEQKMLAWSLVIARGAVQAMTNLGVVCREISVHMRRMTMRIFWQVVTTDMRHLNRLFQQNQLAQQMPEWERDSGSRSSNG